MRSLSKVIKYTELKLKEPRLIQSFSTPDEQLDNLAAASLLEENIALAEDDAISREQENLEDLKLEGEKILAETEQIVMDLLEKARSEARGIIQDAQEEADHIRAEVYEEAKTIRETARDEGYEEGLTKARQDMEEDLQAALLHKEEILEEARREKIEIIQSTENDIVRLVMAIAKKVIASELIIQPQSIVNIVREAINHLDNPENIRVYLNPEDLQLVLDALEFEELTEVGNQALHMQARSDRRIQSGGCLVESSAGSVDACLETRMKKVEESIYGIAGNE